MSSWGVFHTLKAGGRRQLRLRLVLTGVPDGLTKAKVTAALEAAGCAADYSEGGIAWANHELRAEARWPAELVSDERATRMTWEQLEGAQTARSLTLKVPPADYATIALAAAQAGEQLYPWCRRVLLEAAT